MDNVDTCYICNKEIPPGPDFCSQECEQHLTIPQKWWIREDFEVGVNSNMMFEFKFGLKAMWFVSRYEGGQFFMLSDIVWGDNRYPNRDVQLQILRNFGKKMNWLYFNYYLYNERRLDV